MLGWLLFGLTVAAGVALGRLADRRRFVATSGTLLGCVLFAFAGVDYWMVRTLPLSFETQGDAIINMFVLAGLFLAIAVAWMPYLSGFLSEGLVSALPRWWMGDHRISMPVSFDKGDAAMKAGEPGRALALYRAELERHSGEPDLFLRMAEAQRALGDPRQEAACLREAARCAAEPHRKGPILLQLSERLQKGGDAAGAREALRGLLADPALAAYHAPARGRLAGPSAAG